MQVGTSLKRPKEKLKAGTSLSRLRNRSESLIVGASWKLSTFAKISRLCFRMLQQLLLRRRRRVLFRVVAHADDDVGAPRGLSVSKLVRHGHRQDDDDQVPLLLLQVQVQHFRTKIFTFLTKPVSLDFAQWQSRKVVHYDEGDRVSTEFKFVVTLKCQFWLLYHKTFTLGNLFMTLAQCHIIMKKCLLLAIK